MKNTDISWESEEAQAAAKEAPCYGSQIIEDHEFGGGRCVYCGFPQPGAGQGRRFKPMFEDEEDDPAGEVARENARAVERENFEASQHDEPSA